MSKDEFAKEGIVLKAQLLFQLYGLKKTSMDEIALACGKAKSTMYDYFNRKEEVFEEVIKLEPGKLRREVKRIVDHKKQVKDKIRVYSLNFNKTVTLLTEQIFS